MEDTTAQMKEDTPFFDETKAACATKADAWTERLWLRTEDLEGIEKALEHQCAVDIELGELFGAERCRFITHNERAGSREQ